jgi:arsenate reductase-like glutaredoxin family protein
MVTIYSRKDEGSVELVLDWLHHKGEPFTRIFPETISEISRKPECKSYTIQPANLPEQKPSTYWLRNWSKPTFLSNKDLPGLEKNMEADLLAVHDLEALQSGMESLIRNVEKPRQLTYAVQHDLRIPETLITNNKHDLSKFIAQHKSVITKPLAYPYTLHDPAGKKKPKLSYTRAITEAELNNLPEVFSYGLFQKMIEKQYEIRTFYLNGKCWSMAIFSQASEQTKVDFRNYNLENRNRSVPFQLPEEMEDKIRQFMNTCGLNWGSLDFAVDKNDNFVFFEVNPQGQFGMVSNPCNYYLEKEIADFISSKTLY